MTWLQRLWEWLVGLFRPRPTPPVPPDKPHPPDPPESEPYLLAGPDTPLGDGRGPMYWRRWPDA